MASDEIRDLAEIIARWVDDVPGISAVYLFGSRVRGDHRPDSDVDLRLFLDEMGNDYETTTWWFKQNGSDFWGLKSKLPGPLALHCRPGDPDHAIKKGMANPVLVVRKVWCVYTPPKLSFEPSSLAVQRGTYDPTTILPNRMP
jgi:predicted nucleotidyltransferase